VTVRVRIDTLVLDNLGLPRRERDALVTAIEREITLIARGTNPTAANQLRPPGSSSRVDQIATHVATAIHRSVPAIGVAHVQRGRR
jgi:hypothetical protein